LDHVKKRAADQAVHRWVKGSSSQKRKTGNPQREKRAVFDLEAGTNTHRKGTAKFLENVGERRTSGRLAREKRASRLKGKGKGGSRDLVE